MEHAIHEHRRFPSPESSRCSLLRVTVLQQRKHSPDYALFFIAVVLCTIGTITVFSASTVVDIQSGLPAAYFAQRQLLFSVIGFVLMIAVSRIPSHIWYRFTVPMMAGNLGLLLLVLGVGRSAYGGRRWIGTSSMHLQPSELAIVTTAMYLSYFFSRKVHVLENFNLGLRPALIVMALNFGLIFAEPDMGTALTLLGVSIAIIFASGVRIKRVLIVLGSMFPILVVLALSASYRSSRIQAFLHPFANAKGSAYQVIQGWTAIAAGGWFGQGFDMSIAKTGYLPFPYTDFIFAVFTEEWGFVGAVVLLLLLIIFAWRGFRIARHAATRFEALLSVGLTSMVAVAAIINLGVVTGLFPVTGIPLPFISYGGTSILVYLGAVGILLGISRSTLVAEPEVEPLAEIMHMESARRVPHKDRGRRSWREVSATKEGRRPQGHRTRSRQDRSLLTWREEHQRSKTSTKKLRRQISKWDR